MKIRHGSGKVGRKILSRGRRGKHGKKGERFRFGFYFSRLEGLPRAIS